MKHGKIRKKIKRPKVLKKITQAFFGIVLALVISLSFPLNSWFDENFIVRVSAASIFPKPKIALPKQLIKKPKKQVRRKVRIVEKFYNVPVDKKLQSYVHKVCTKYGVDEKMVYGLMYTESTFNPKAISRWGDYGIMQINKCNHKWLKKELGITNFLDPYQNVLAGVYMLSTIGYSNPHKRLMVYNLGSQKAKSLWKKGRTSSSYSRKIMNFANSLI